MPASGPSGPKGPRPRDPNRPDMGLRRTLERAGGKLKRAFATAFIPVPDHPARGGNTGDLDPDERDPDLNSDERATPDEE